MSTITISSTPQEQQLQEQQQNTTTTDLPEITIVDYNDEQHRAAFKAMNIAWISVHWEMEERDYEELDKVEENILGLGGFILMAMMNGEAVGTVAMIPMDGTKYDYEFAKFTTTTAVRGRGLGMRLAQAALDKARGEGKSRFFIVTNKLCESAIHIYKKLGFVLLPGRSEIFERGDTLMELCE